MLNLRLSMNFLEGELTVPTPPCITHERKEDNLFFALFGEW
jgi:hypothetical protein